MKAISLLQEFEDTKAYIFHKISTEMELQGYETAITGDILDIFFDLSSETTIHTILTQLSTGYPITWSDTLTLDNLGKISVKKYANSD